MCLRTTWKENVRSTPKLGSIKLLVVLLGKPFHTLIFTLRMKHKIKQVVRSSTSHGMTQNDNWSLIIVTVHNLNFLDCPCEILVTTFKRTGLSKIELSGDHYKQYMERKKIDTA